MSLFEKIKWILGILLIFVVVLTTNLIDRGNFNRIRNSVVTIYEDRIVANDLIFEMTSAIHEKEVAFRTSDTGFLTGRNKDLNSNLVTIIERYQQTKLTPVEVRVFENLKSDLKDLEQLESSAEGPGQTPKTLQKLQTIKSDLKELSKIQLSEAKREVSLTETTFKTIDLFTKIEIIFLVLLAVIVQIIILFNPKQK